MNPSKIVAVLICRIKSIYYSRYIDGDAGRIVVTDSRISIRIDKGKGSKLIIKGELIVSSHIGGHNPIVLILGENSVLEIAGDFIIGNGVTLTINARAVLYFGGQDKESGSGITSDTIVMCNERIIIGKDFLCARGVFISDSDWHSIGSQKHQALSLKIMFGSQLTHAC